MPDKPTILVVERTQRNLDLLAQFLGKQGYHALTGASLEELDHILAKPQPIVLALVDIGGFDRRIWERCERLLEKEIPFFVLAHGQSATLAQESFSHGARGVLAKPLAIRALLGIIHGLLAESP
jgi:DNA-binding response OmpR family regulator